MVKAINNTGLFKNAESPFTEIYSIFSDTLITPSFIKLNKNNLRVVSSHIDNTSEILLQGLQAIGGLISMVADMNESDNKCRSLLGEFITIISNLLEAVLLLGRDIREFI